MRFQKAHVIRHIKRLLPPGIVFLILGIGLVLKTVFWEFFALSIYMPFSRRISGWLGWFFSLLPIPFAEIGVYLLILFFFGYAIFAIIFSLRSKTAWPLLRWVADTIFGVVALLFLFILLWGGNYFAPPLEVRLGLDMTPQSEEVLFETALFHRDRMIEAAALADRSESFDILAEASADSMKRLAEDFPEILGGGHISPPKRIWTTPLWGRLGVMGIYSPLTGEAFVNPITTTPFLPAVMNHELAHRLGIAPEDEANFIAYLAGAQSPHPMVRYSVELMAFLYCLRALENEELQRVLLEGIPREIWDDVQNHQEAWASYRGAMSQWAERVNDVYLQAMGQEEGIESYGRVVDLLIAWKLSTPFKCCRERLADSQAAGTSRQSAVGSLRETAATGGVQATRY